MGVATYAHELMRSVNDLDAIYVPIGLGSGICGNIAVRDMLGVKTKIIGVVAEQAPAYSHSFASGVITPSNSAASFADGMAVRIPNPDAFDIIRKGVERIVQVNEDEIANAVRSLYVGTHNVAEGAGAAAYAALIKESRQMAGRRVAVVMSGGNIDGEKMSAILSRKTPSP